MQNCKYKLPCGWCDRKNEMCMYELQTQNINESLDCKVTNKPVCEHVWYCSGANTLGWVYTCSKCGKTEHRSYSYIDDQKITTTNRDFIYANAEQSSENPEVDHIIRTVKNGKLPKINGTN